MKRLRRLVGNSCLWRSLSPKSRSHLLIVGSAGLAFAVVLAARLNDGHNLVESVGVAVNAGVMLFLSWAVAREIDPDNPGSAFAAAAVGALILLGGTAPAGALVGVLLALRIVIRTTGKHPSPLDLVVVPLLSAVFAFTPRGWIGGLAMAAALVWDTLLPEPGSLRNRGSALVALVAAVAVTTVQGTLGEGFRNPKLLGWVVLAGAMVAFALMNWYVPRSPCDRSRGTVDVQRLKAGWFLALSTGIFAFVWFGGNSVSLLAGLWAALIGVPIAGRLLSREPSPA